MRGFIHRIEVRYGECDQQGVVFNANYLAYADDAMDHWMRSAGDLGWIDEWDVMLKAATVTWHGPARWPDLLDVACRVSRWGTTSFDVTYDMAVDDREVATVVITYVSVLRGSADPVPTPDRVRAGLGD